MALVAENIHDKIQLSLRTISGARDPAQVTRRSQAIIESEQRKIQALEEFVRMPHQDYLKAYEQLETCSR